ncbi:c-type cytochrome biogenesis protein CcsB [Desulfogranum japonicum]|uniref:c-type cytochrome biogenesis protein CcsB n=1 Tax=Desulfogranum japonicum TaxID=231447 RepID=UPI00040A2648|nr:c-type cytochrome biogenesis protein CcsB [Desulfogranum japonicum]
MDSSTLLGLTMLAYLLSTAFHAGQLVFRSKGAGLVGLFLAVLGLLIQTAGIGLRWTESYAMGIGHAPLTNMYESLVFFAWCTTLFYVLIDFKYKARVLGMFTMPLSFIAMAYASFSGHISADIKPLLPALQSNWLIAHVVTCFIGYGAFAVAAALGVMYLVKLSSQSGGTNTYTESALPALTELDDLTHKTIVFGFMWLSAGIITGAIWANEAWGTYWSWDAKETWSLITWFLYAITLHVRFTIGWTGKRIAWLAIFGFFAVLFTYFGVNYLLAGLHSYGTPG